jgi:hypothetical protein
MKFQKALAIIAITLASAAAPAAAAEIASHEAVYRLTLKDLRMEGWSDTAGGILELKISRDCHFWKLDRKLEFRIKFTDGRRTHMIVNEKIRESLDGERFWFWSRTTVNGATASIIAGEAARLITIEPEKPKVAKGDETAKPEEGPTLEDLVSTPEELAQKAAEEAAKKAEEEKAEKAAKGETGKDAEPEGDTAVARGEDDDKKSEGEQVKAAEVGPVEMEKDADSVALAEAAAEAKAEAEAKAAAADEKATGEDPEKQTAVLLDKDGKPIVEKEGRTASIVSYAWPEAEDVEVPLETIFPFTALQAQLDALANKSLQRSFTIFDGTSPNGALRVHYRPVRSVAIAAIKPKGSVELLDTTSWRYSATYMRADGKSNKPVRIVIAQTHRNGVVSEMILDLGAFSIKGDLAWIKSTGSPVCE